MAIVSQTWTRYPMVDSIYYPTNYLSGTFIEHLTQFFTNNTAQWTISASSANYVELKPPAGAINTNDRILFWGGIIPNAAASAHTATLSATYVYVCYAPNAGTTGPDVLPSVGNPYTGVISSKLINVGINVLTRNMLQVFQSNDCISIWAGADSAAPVGSNVCFVGRAYNPSGTTDQFTLVAGGAVNATAAWSTLLETETSNWTADLSFSGTDIAIYVQESSGDVAWTPARRVNGWDSYQWRTEAQELGYYFNIQLGANRSANNEFLGEVLFAKAGPSKFHGVQIADTTTIYGYSISNAMSVDTASTWYLWNE